LLESPRTSSFSISLLRAAMSVLDSLAVTRSMGPARRMPRLAPRSSIYRLTALT
jgi:hypothetical protein